jgi:uncharacterized protein (DUF983 family)
MQDRRGRRRWLALRWGGVCLRCPRCGARSLFRTWLAMHEQCAVCGLRFEREQGYFMGAMYINYGVTVVLALLGSVALEAWTQPSLTSQLVLWVGFGTVFPVLFFRYARGVWLRFDYLCDPGAAAEPEHRSGKDDMYLKRS